MDDAECECSINANRDGRLFEAAARNATARLGGRAAATDTRAYRAIAQIYYMWVNRARKEEERERGGRRGRGGRVVANSRGFSRGICISAVRCSR